MKDKCDFVKPGEFHLYYGGMWSGKTQKLNSIISPLDVLKQKGLTDFLTIKPKIDTRQERSLGFNPVLIEHPRVISELVNKNIETVIIDEIQLFDNGIFVAVNDLLGDNKYVVAAGLDRDFRGEYFGPMQGLLALAELKGKSERLGGGVCAYKNCRRIAERTQRLVDGYPADYYDPIIIIEGENKKITYEPRCLKHHNVPNSPKSI